MAKVLANTWDWPFSNSFARALQLFVWDVGQNRTGPVVVVLIFVGVRWGCCGRKADSWSLGVGCRGVRLSA